MVVLCFSYFVFTLILVRGVRVRVMVVRVLHSRQHVFRFFRRLSRHGCGLLVFTPAWFQRVGEFSILGDF